MKYFSIDYRSPPSGLGQIVNTNFPPIADHMILVSYPGCGMKDDPSYSHTIFIDHPECEEEGWIGPALPQLIQILKALGVTEVYDSEEGFNHPDKCDSRHHFKLEDWIKIVNTSFHELRYV